MGFAVSAIFYQFGYLNLTPMGYLGVTNVLLAIFMNGLISAAGVWLIHTAQEALERTSPEK
jgi:hypothetical protein